MAADTRLSLRVEGNRLIDGEGSLVQLHGVNRSGTEYACVQGWGIFDGPTDDPSVQALMGWRVNAVRLGLNEDCWLAINNVDERFSGTRYREALHEYVDLLHSHGIYVVLALMWAAPGLHRATWQEAMADADHSTSFWSSVADEYRNDPGTLFDLYGEPAWIDWPCWRDGCSYKDVNGVWQTAGMQSMLDAVRRTGAKNVVLVSGRQYANDLSEWGRYRPHDRAGQLAASVHVYGDNSCHENACWDVSILGVLKLAPVVTSELGEDSAGKACSHHFLERYLAYADRHGLSYLAWTWDTWHSCLALVKAYDGAPTVYGASYREHLAAHLTSSKPDLAGLRTDSGSLLSRGVTRLPRHFGIAVWLAILLVAAVAGGVWFKKETPS